MNTIEENKLQKDFSKFQIEFPYTQLIRYNKMLVYSPKGNTGKALQDANDLIERLELNLSAKESKLVSVSTIVIEEKI